MSDLKSKIDRLKDAAEDLDTLLFLLQGGLNYNELRGDKTIKEMTLSYSNDGNYLTQIINDIIREHGDETCPHEDEQHG